MTATYRTENLQTTPLSITAVTADMLTQRSITSITDVAQIAPNVTMRVASTGAGRSNYAYIRGIGQGDFLLAYSPRVSFYIDDVYFSTVFGSVFDLVDVDRIEILRGPQGTLFGRNAAGGAIRIFSKKPVGDGSGFAEALYGNYNHYGAKAGFDVPLIEDKLMFRSTTTYHKQDGYVDRINFACLHPELAGLLPQNAGTADPNSKKPCKVGTLGGTDIFSTREQLRYVGNGWENNIAVDYTNDNSEASPDTLTAPPYYNTYNPTTGAGSPVTALLGGVPTTLPANQIANGLGVWMNLIGGPSYNLPLSGPVPNYYYVFNDPSNGFAPTFAPAQLPSAALMAAMYPNNPYVSYAIGQNPGTNSQLWRPATPGDPGPQFDDPAISTIKSWGLSDVFDLDITDKIHAKAVTAYRQYSGVFGASQASMPLPIQESFQGVTHHQFSEEIQITGNLWDNKIEWTAGGFYLNSKERNYGRVQFEGFAVGGALFVQDFQINDPSTLHNRSGFVTATIHVTDKLDLSGGIRYSHEVKTYQFFRNYYYFLGIPTGSVSFTQPTSGTTNKWTPRVALQYQVTDDLMAYASYSTGFTAGGINGRPFSPTGVFPFGPETVTSYEAGVKSEWLDKRLRVNADVFWTDYTNMQVTLFGCNDPALCAHSDIFYVDNGGSSRIKGAEIEVEAQLTPEWLIQVSGGLTDFHYRKLNPQVNPSNDPLGLTLSSPLFGQPKYKLSIATQYNFDLGPAGTVIPHIDAVYQSKEWFDTARVNPLSGQPGYWLSNARITWRAASDQKWSVAFAVTNLFDKLYYATKFDGRTGFGYASGSVQPPREWTITIRRDF